jgi:hypothetical protein
MTMPRRRLRLLVALVALLVLAAVAGCSGSSRGGGTSDDAEIGSTSGRVLWRPDATPGGVLNSFESTPWNTDDAEAPRAVASPDVPGRTAVAFTVPGGGTRSELEPRFGDFGNGDRYWFGLSIFLPEDFPVDTDTWQVVAQWKNGGDGSPPLSLKVEGGRFVLDGGAGIGEAWQQDLGPARTGRSTDLVVGVLFSDDPDTGRVDVWQDGREVLRAFHPPAGTLYPDEDSYLKIGLYRDSAIDEDGTVYYDDVVVADGRAAASGLAAAP